MKRSTTAGMLDAAAELMQLAAIVAVLAFFYWAWPGNGGPM